MRITLIAVGKSKHPEADVWAQRYITRLPWKLSVVELPESRAATSSARKTDEAARMRPLIAKADRCLVCDVQGEQLTSEGLADIFRNAALAGEPHMACVLGGPDGIDASVLAVADYRVAFGRMTWPHLMARVMLLEQIYRAYTLVQGHPYHRG